MSNEVTVNDNIIDFDDDLSTAEAPKPLPEGSYPAQVVGAEIKAGKQDPSQKYVAVTLRVSKEDFPVDYVSGREFVDLTYRRLTIAQSPEAKYAFKSFKEALGLDTKGGKVDIQEFIGNTASIEIKHEEWQGNLRANIAAVKKAA